MPIADRVSQFVRDNYDLFEWRHASTIMAQDFPHEWADFVELLEWFRFDPNWIIRPGGRKSEVSGAIDGFLYHRGWTERHFETAFLIDEVRFNSPTHSIDCFRNRIGLEVEWNNKDPFFGRDLNNFRLLFELRALSVGIIITRAEDIHGLRRELRGEGFGTASTHISKLLPKIEGGGAGSCPVIAVGLRRSLLVRP